MSNNLAVGNNSLTTLPQIVRSTRQVKKKRILVHSDAVIATTGFGVVSKHILEALYATGKYEIDQLAINFFGDFYDRDKVPYTLIPAKLKDPGDPYGSKMLLEAISAKNYDYIFIINDTFVVESMVEGIKKIKDAKRVSGKKSFKLVYYYPVDCRFLPQASGMVNLADVAVAYTKFAAESTKEVLPHKPDKVIYHGADIHHYKPLDKEERDHWRRQYLNITSPDTILIMNANRNSIRKDIARSILVFSEFRKKVPKTLLYLHTVPVDGVQGQMIIDLAVPCRELGLNPKTDVVFPLNYSAAKGFPEHILNRLYNTADIFLTTHTGEGFGLSIGDAMAAGVPVVVPDNTVTPELVGEERGYPYKCKERVFIDNSGYRNWGRMEDILETLFKCHEDIKSGAVEKKILAARAFTQKYSWDNVCKDWVKLFAELDARVETEVPQIEAEVI